MKLEWAPKLLMRFYPPMYLDGADAAASPIVHAFRNGKLRYGHQGPWCIGTATWLLVEKGPVIVVGIDLEHAIQDAEQQPCTTMQGLVDKSLSLAGRDPADSASRVRFQVYAASGSALWVPQGIALALFGIAEGGYSSVVFFPWLSMALAEEHRASNEICGKSIAQVSVHTLRRKEGETAYHNAQAAVPFFSSSQSRLTVRPNF